MPHFSSKGADRERRLNGFTFQREKTILCTVGRLGQLPIFADYRVWYGMVWCGEMGWGQVRFGRLR